MPTEQQRLQEGPPPNAIRPAASDPLPLAPPDLLSVIAHDLRAPLAALTTAAELLVAEMDTFDVARVRGMLTILNRSTLALHSLLEDFLGAATSEAGWLAMDPEPVDLLTAVRENQTTLAPLLLQKAQRLRISVRGGPPKVLADRRQVDQVLLNLLANASKFGAPGRPIDVRLVTRAAQVRLTVANCGVSLPPGDAAMLFEPFVRAPTSEATEGLGLGLAIVRSIVVAHGGRVGAQNRRGGGASFWIELPCAPA
jgi:signal transduction histidine kinase